MRPCFAFAPAADNKPAMLTVFDEIGFWGSQAKDFVNQLSALEGDSIRVEINSPGGDAFAALAMYNALRMSGKEVTTVVMGVAASAASVLMLAGDKREMPSNTFVMVHNPMMGVFGNSAEMRDAAETLDKIAGSLVSTYVDRTGLDEAKVTEMLSTDTWITAQEALDMGFATDITNAVEATAKFDMERASLPDEIKAVFAKKQAEVAPPKPEPSKAFADQVLAMSTEAGLEKFAAQWAINHTEIAAVKAAISSAVEIKALCNVAGKPDMADQFVAKGNSIAEARTSLLEVLANADEHIDTAAQSNSNAPGNDAGKAAISVADVYAKRQQSVVNKGVSK